jgi:hypothetical protein
MDEVYCDASLGLALGVIFASLLSIVVYVFISMCWYRTTDIQCVIYASAQSVIQYRRLTMPLVAQWHHDRYSRETPSSDDIVEFEEEQIDTSYNKTQPITVVSNDEEKLDTL